MTERQPDAITPLVSTAVDDLTGGSRPRIISEHLAHHICTRLAQQVAAVASSQTLLSLLTTNQAATELGISRRRVQALARSRDIGWRIGHEIVLRPEDIDALRERRPGRPPTT